MKIKNSLLLMSAMSVALAAFGQETITPAADARIDGGAPDTNFGNAVELFARDGGENPANNEKTYLAFDLSGLLGSGQSISSSSFSLTLSRLGSATTAGTLTVYGITDNADTWTEGGITWSNAPKNDTFSGSGVLGNTVVLGTATIPAGAGQDTQITFSASGLTEYLNWIAGANSNPYGNGASADATATLIVTGGNEVLGAFYTKEGTGLPERLPQLQVTVSGGEDDGLWSGYTVLENGDVDTGDFLGWINVIHGDWVWSYNEGCYIYLPEEIVSVGGAWLYVPR